MFRNLFLAKQWSPHRSIWTARRLSLEGLEARVAPAILHWSGTGANSNMSLALNYVEKVKPAQGDTIVFDGNHGVLSSKPAIADKSLFHIEPRVIRAG